MNSAREDVLGRVRAALRDVPHGEQPGDVAVERGYRHSGEAPLNAFAERVSDYGADVRLASTENVRDVLASACAEHGAQRLAIPPGLPDALRPPALELLEDDVLSHASLDAVDGVITGCTTAIAETGTIALAGGPGEGRRALTLIPDLHLCVVAAERIVATVPEATAELAGAVRDRMPVTLISGPSATSDIELSRVEGVHGPRTLVVVIVERTGALTPRRAR